VEVKRLKLHRPASPGNQALSLTLDLLSLIIDHHLKTFCKNSLFKIKAIIDLYLKISSLPSHTSLLNETNTSLKKSH